MQSDKGNKDTRDLEPQRRYRLRSFPGPYRVFRVTAWLLRCERSNLK